MHVQSGVDSRLSHTCQKFIFLLNKFNKSQCSPKKYLEGLRYCERFYYFSMNNKNLNGFLFVFFTIYSGQLPDVILVVSKLRVEIHREMFYNFIAICCILK